MDSCAGRGCPFAYSREIGALVKARGEAGAGGQECEAQEDHAGEENARREGVHESAQGGAQFRHSVEGAGEDGRGHDHKNEGVFRTLVTNLILERQIEAEKDGDDEKENSRHGHVETAEVWEKQCFEPKNEGAGAKHEKGNEVFADDHPLARIGRGGEQERGFGVFVFFFAEIHERHQHAEDSSENLSQHGGELGIAPEQKRWHSHSDEQHQEHVFFNDEKIFEHEMNEHGEHLLSYKRA